MANELAAGKCTQSIIKKQTVNPDAPTVSVVIPLYNKGRYIARALSSVLTQTYQPLEVIIVDDGSTDDGPEKVLDFRDPRISLLRLENGGPGAARNAGLAMAKGTYISFLDADDEWLPPFLETGISFLEDTTPKVTGVWTGYYRYPSMRKNNAEMKDLAGVYEINAETSIALLRNIVNFIWTCTAVMRTDMVRKWGGFFGQYKCLTGEDRYLFLKILFNERIGLIPEHYGIYHIEASDLCHGPGPCPDPVPPYLADCSDIAAYCPESKRDLLYELLTSLALEKAMLLTYSGQTEDAKALINRFSGNAWRNPMRFAVVSLLVQLSPLVPAARWCLHLLNKSQGTPDLILSAPSPFPARKNKGRRSMKTDQ
ncbi:MAG: glycosyltransferase family 2 protein [Thermodesulfovibrio sp.]|nr:glycosyltransferase family 2 protein [Thermodesulfovibrio sp.]